MTPRSFLIITKSDDGNAVSLGSEVESWLKAQGADARILEHKNTASEFNSCAFGPSPCLILVLGGDGTFISVARRTLGSGMPVLGLDLGRVGFLAELSPESWRDALSEIIVSGLDVRSRMAMAFDVVRAGEVVRSGMVVNDLVVSRGALARLVTLGLTFDGERISSLRSDGIIISTPSGSTAYCASAGGPVVHPEIHAFSVAPICPFLNTFRPLVVPGDMVIHVRVEEASGLISLTEDGQSATDLRQGDILTVRRSPSDLLIGHCGRASYFQKLKEKGFITQR